MRMEREMGQESGEKSTECYEAPLNRQESIDPRAEREAVRRSDWIHRWGNARVAGYRRVLISRTTSSPSPHDDFCHTDVPQTIQLAELPVTLVSSIGLATLKHINRADELIFAFLNKNQNQNFKATEKGRGTHHDPVTGHTLGTGDYISSYKGLLATRFFLGAVEGGLYPATVLFVSNSYKRFDFSPLKAAWITHMILTHSPICNYRNEIQFRISLFSSAAALSGALSGVFAFYLIQLDGVCNIPGWGWIFLVEGIFTTLCGVAGFFIFPRSISTCRLLTPEQRRIMSTRLELDRPLEAQETEERFSWYQMCCALKSPHVLLASAALFMIGSNLYGLAYFEPSIVKSVSPQQLVIHNRNPSTVELTSAAKPPPIQFGYSPRITQLVSVPPFAVGFISMLLTSYLSDRYGARGITAILMGLIAFAGYLMFMISNSDSFRYFSLFLSVAGIYSASPTMYAWLANNSAPHYRKASAIALGPIAANSGGILSTWLFPSSQQPRYPTATIVNLCFSAGIAILCSLNLLWLRSCNKKKAAQIEETVVLTEKGQSTAKNLDDGEWLRLGDKCQNFRYAY
ncbi:hypothetical protein PSTT_09284 [Puccinia striiformis]|uniref:Major facilitator superfamily (MFS) profile domain-containing protein n=1 Tax=Puccinia striiformis TaxID=27350 RepID=A0A2S4V8Y7_9BASI|nr:hypothetical protein PSTT_09284 [Puccinia striiformis]